MQQFQKQSRTDAIPLTKGIAEPYVASYTENDIPLTKIKLKQSYNMKYYLMSLLNIKLLFISGLIAPIIGFLDKYVYSDWEFFSSVIIIVLINSFFGLIIHFKAKTLNPNAFFSVFYKMLTYLLLLIAFKAVAHFKINGAVNAMFNWLDYGIYSAIMIQEALTLLKNTATLGIFVAPKWMISKLEMFGDDGKISAPETVTKTIENQVSSNGNAH